MIYQHIKLIKILRQLFGNVHTYAVKMMLTSKTKFQTM